jgi:hypothetical protein
VKYYEVIKNFDKRWRFDFYLPSYNLYIEIFGIEGKKNYNEKVISKQNVCKENNINLVSIFPMDFINNNYKAEEILHKYNIKFLSN